MEQEQDRPIDVLHLMFSYNIGGKERVILDVLTARQDGPLHYGVAVLNDNFNPELIGKLRATGASVILMRRKRGSRSLGAFLALAGLMRRRKVRLLHTRELKLVPLALLLRLLRPSLRLVASFHNTNLMQAAGRAHIWILNHLYQRRVAISQAVRQECESFGLRDILVMNNAVDTARFAAVPRLAGPAGTLRLICVARYLLKQKAQDALLEAVARCRDAGIGLSCVLLGNVDGRNEADLRILQDMSRRLDLEAVVRFETNRTDVENYLAQADLFVLPSHFEGFGNAVVEAMAAGLPVLVSKVDGLAEFVTQDQTGLFIRPANIDDMAQQIAWAASHRPQLAAMGEAGRSAAARYDIAAYAARYEALYRGLLSS